MPVVVITIIIVVALIPHRINSMLLAVMLSMVAVAIAIILLITVELLAVQRVVAVAITITRLLHLRRVDIIFPHITLNLNMVIRHRLNIMVLLLNNKL